MHALETLELWSLLEGYVQKKQIKPSHVLAFLTTSLVGTAEKHGLSQEFFDKTCDRMKVKFAEKRRENDPI